MRLWLAIRTFCAVLFNAQLATEVNRLLGGAGREQPAPATPGATEKPAARAPVAQPVSAPPRNDAITLVAALQREARFVDIVKEPLGDYPDEKIGAAARDVLRDCGAVLDRFFAIQPLVEDAEGAELETPADFDTARYRLTGNVSGNPPFRGQLVHHGWQATRCELPQWSGSEESTMLVAPVELEIR